MGVMQNNMEDTILYRSSGFKVQCLLLAGTQIFSGPLAIFSAWLSLGRQSSHQHVCATETLKVDLQPTQLFGKVCINKVNVGSLPKDTCLILPHDRSM